MKLISAGSEQYRAYAGQEFSCPKTDNRYQVEAKDISEAIAKAGGIRIRGVVCPDCGKMVQFCSDQRDGEYIMHS